MKLVVVQPFTKTFGEGETRERRSYAVGQEITDAGDIKAVRETHKGYVVQTAAEPPEGDPAFAKATAAARRDTRAEPDTVRSSKT